MLTVQALGHSQVPGTTPPPPKPTLCTTHLLGQTVLPQSTHHDGGLHLSLYFGDVHLVQPCQPHVVPETLPPFDVGSCLRPFRRLDSNISASRVVMMTGNG
jgi:hypothetical protein